MQVTIDRCIRRVYKNKKKKRLDLLQSYMDYYDLDSIWKLKFAMKQDRRNSSLVRKQKKKYIGINRCDLSIITITLLHKKELATMKPSTSMMSSPTSVAIAGRGTMDEAMANTSFSKVCLWTPKLKTQCCYNYKADECICHRQYKIEQRSQIQAPQLDIIIGLSEVRLHWQAFILYGLHKTTNIKDITVPKSL